jgi:hypothetical protein
VRSENDFACLPCSHGTYKEETDRQPCTACPAGTNTMEFGSFDEQEYVSCAGYYMVFDMISLGAAFACAIGTYSDHLNMNACEPCFAGAT